MKLIHLDYENKIRRNIANKFLNEIISKKETKGVKDLLYHKFFDDFRIKPKDLLKEKDDIISHIYLTGFKEPKEAKNTNNRLKLETYINEDHNTILGFQDNLLSKHNIMSKKNNKNLNVQNIENSFTRIINDSLNNDIHIIRIDNDSIQVGGGDQPEIAPYRAEKNDPSLTNEKRKIFDKRNIENPIKEPPKLLEQTIYDTTVKEAPKSQFPPNFIPLYDQDGSVESHLLPYSKIVNQPPVQKVYNVSLTNPLGNHTSINRIYEDVLPSDKFDFTALTIFERRQLIDNLRNTMITLQDGEDMSISGSKNSLLSLKK